MTDNFKDRAAEWDNPAKKAMTTKFVAALKEKVQLNSAWKALEIGAGTGLVGLQLLPQLKSLVFEDTSAAMLGVLKDKLQGNEPVEIVEGEIFEYTKQDINLVFSCMAFHHIPDIKAAVNHLAKICLLGAIVAVGDIRTEDGSFHHFEPIPHKGFDTNELSAIFSAAGFKVHTAETYNVLNRERTPGVFTDYEQFLLIAERI